MAKEVLAVPEDYLKDVIRVIRRGLKEEKRIPRTVRHNLAKWCREEEAYLKRLESDDGC